MKSFLLTILLLIFPLQASAITEEMRCLALNIYHEARGEEAEGQMAVAHTTLNRVQSSRFPNTICGVVWQHRQFSWTQDGRSDTPRDAEAWRQSVYVAYLSARWHSMGEDFSHGALFYHEQSVNPRWNRSMHEVLQIGAHRFFVE